jgi:PD-(D/E)XK nuclease superfamily
VISEPGDWAPYFEQLRLIHQAQAISSARVRAPSTFSLFRCLLPNELTLSNFLARLFDPREDHGAGAMFLDAFLRAAGVVLNYEIGKVEVHREFPTTTNRQIDIVIDFGDAIIGIENKPWAQEQPSQVQDYANDLKAKHREWWLVYLSGDGRVPRSIDTEASSQLRATGRLYVLSYERLADAIRESSATCSVGRTARLIEDFCDYVREGFAVGHKTYQELDVREKQLVDLALEPARLGVTLDLLSVGQAIEDRIVYQFLDHCRQAAHRELGRDWRVEVPGGSFARKFAQLKFFKAHWSGKYAIGFEAQQPDGLGFVFGIMYWDRRLTKKLDGGRVRQGLDRVFRLNSSTVRDYGNWDWYFPIRRLDIQDGWCDPAVRLRMATDPDFASSLVALVKRATDVAGQAIDSAVTRGG